MQKKHHIQPNPQMWKSMANIFFDVFNNFSPDSKSYRGSYFQYGIGRGTRCHCRVNGRGPIAGCNHRVPLSVLWLGGRVMTGVTNNLVKALAYLACTSDVGDVMFTCVTDSLALSLHVPSPSDSVFEYIVGSPPFLQNAIVHNCSLKCLSQFPPQHPEILND